MFELLSGGVVGSVLGGLFRFAPEVLKWLDRKNERAHELAMFGKQCDLERLKGQQKLAEIGAEHANIVDGGVVAAFKSAIDQQTEMVKTASRWVASLSASVRPVMTYYLLALYGGVKTATLYIAYSNGAPLAEVLVKAWGPDDMALLCGVVNYWIMDRTLAKRGLA